MAVAPLALSFQSGQRTYNFQDPKGVSGLSITIDSPLEPVYGHANGVSGSIIFDPKSPEKSTGKIVVDSKSVFIGSQGMTDATHQEWCLDVKKYPTIEFEVQKISGVKKTGTDTYTASVTGKFSLHGETKVITVPATATYLPKGIKQRGGMQNVDGDLLAIRSKFSINRLDYKVSPDLSTKVIGNKIDLSLAFVGYSPDK